MAQKENAAEQHESDLLTLSLLLLRFQASQARDAVSIVQEIQRQIIATISRIDPFDARTRAVQLSRTERLLTAIRDEIFTKFESIQRNQSKALTDLARVEMTQTLDSINQIARAPIANARLDAEDLRAIVSTASVKGAPLKEVWKRQAQEAYYKIADAIRQSVFRGETKAQLETILKGTRELRNADGLFARARQNATTLAHTAANYVANQARLQTYEANGDLIAGIIWQSIIDNRTTKLCLSLHQKEWTLPDYTPVRHDKLYPGPTPHFNCRSSQLAIFKPWKELAGLRVPTEAGGSATVESIAEKSWRDQNLSDGDVADIKRSFDGGKPTLKTFETWLSRQSDEYQNEILGPGRAKLFREGKITISDLTDQTGRELTIAQLESRFDP